MIANNVDVVTVKGTYFDKKVGTAAWGTNGADATVTLVKGVGTLKVRTVGTTGGQTVSLTANKAGEAVSKEGKVELSLKDQVATSLKLERTSGKFLASDSANNAATFSVKVLDQNGKDMKSGFFPVSYTVTGPASPASGTVYYNGTAQTVTINPTQNANGVATVAISATGMAGVTETVTVQQPSIASKFEVTADTNNATAPVANGVSTLRYNIQVTDAAGVPVAGAATVRVTFNVTDTQAPEVFAAANAAADIGTPAHALSASKKYVDVTVTNGTGYFTVETKKMVGELSFSAADTATSNAYTAATGSLSSTFKADAPAAVKLFIAGGTSERASLVLPSTENSLTLTAQLYDAAGNLAPVKDVEVTLAGTADNTTAAANSDLKINGVDNSEVLKTDENGKVSTTLSLINYVGNAYDLAASITVNNATVNSGTTKVSVANSVASLVSVQLYSDANRTIPVSIVTAGETVYARATVKDANGRAITNEQLAWSIPTNGGKVTTAPTFTAGNYDFSFVPESAPSLSFEIATTKSATPVKTSLVLSVRPKAAIGTMTLVGGTAQNITKNTVTAYTVNLADQYGNTVVNDTNGAVNVTLNFTGIQANKLVQVRKAEGGLAVSSQTGNAASASLDIARGATSVTFYVVTDADAGQTFSLAISTTTQGVTLAPAPGAVTFTVK